MSNPLKKYKFWDKVGSAVCCTSSTLCVPTVIGTAINLACLPPADVSSHRLHVLPWLQAVKRNRRFWKVMAQRMEEVAGSVREAGARPGRLGLVGAAWGLCAC